MNILQIKPLAKEFGCTIDVSDWGALGQDIIVTHKESGKVQKIGTLLSVSDMTRKELQAIFESVSGTSLRDWWVGSEAVK